MQASDRGIAALLLRGGLCALVVLAPLPLGSVPRGAVLALQLAAALLFLAAWVSLRASARSISKAPLFAPGLLPVAVPGALLILLGVVQWIPLPVGVVEFVAPETATARRSIEALLKLPTPSMEAVSLSAPDTLDSVLRMTMLMLIAFSAAVLCRSAAAARQLVGCLVLSGSAQAAYGVYQTLSGANEIFGRPNEHYPDVGSGTFVNPNHFAAFLALGIPFALSMAMRQSEAPPEFQASRWKRWVLSQEDPAFRTRVIGAVAFALLWAGVIASQSRSGSAAAGLATLLCLGFATRVRSGSGRWRFGAVALAIPLLVVALWSGPRQPGERWLDHPEQVASLNGRAPVWRTCLQQIPSHALLGAGFGTFEAVFDRYRPPGVRWRWTHAHNEFLQVSLEAGLAGLLAALSLAVLSLRYLHRRLLGPLPLSAAAALASVGSMTLMACVDFPLRIPAVAVATILLPMTAGTAPAGRFRDEDRPR